ncbi:MAG: ATP synthase F0 subunit C [Oscillospiraceae bacterium]|nr:ATP synthase F0 subunit C [Oscillospiraceae bacterium]
MDGLSAIIIISNIAVVLALSNGIVTVFGQAKIAIAAIESISRQPEVAGTVTNTMFISLALAETQGIYGLLVAIILLFANPFIPIYIQYLMGT